MRSCSALALRPVFRLFFLCASRGSSPRQVRVSCGLSSQRRAFAWRLVSYVTLSMKGPPRWFGRLWLAARQLKVAGVQRDRCAPLAIDCARPTEGRRQIRVVEAISGRTRLGHPCVGGQLRFFSESNDSRLSMTWLAETRVSIDFGKRSTLIVTRHEMNQAVSGAKRTRAPFPP